MNYEFKCEGAYPVLEVTLQQGEQLVAESGSMAWMDPGIKTQTKMRGGLGSALKRSLLGGESFFQNEFTATQADCKIGLVAGQPGEIRAIDMTGQRLFMERGAYLASTPEVKIDSSFQGLKGLFAEGMFVLQASGTGTMFWNSYGDIHEIEVSGEYIVDNGFAVAWEESLNYQITRSARIRAFLFTNQLLMRFSGHGKLWVQSRSAQNLAAWIYPFRPVKKKETSSSSSNE